MNINCSICLELLFTESCQVKTTPCGHLFHSHCLERSIQARDNCPQCRNSCSASIRGPIQVYVDSEGTQSEDKFFKLLQNTAENGALAKYKIALEYEDNKNPTNKDGETPLHYASKYGHLDIVKYIMWNIEDKSPKTKYGTAPIHCAAADGHLNAVSYTHLTLPTNREV